MRAKIMAIGIMGMFLLTGFVTVSAENISAIQDEQKNENSVITTIDAVHLFFDGQVKHKRYVFERAILVADVYVEAWCGKTLLGTSDVATSSFGNYDITFEIDRAFIPFKLNVTTDDWTLEKIVTDSDISWEDQAHTKGNTHMDLIKYDYDPISKNKAISLPAIIQNPLRKTSSYKSFIPCLLIIETYAENNGLDDPVTCTFTINEKEKHNLRGMMGLYSMAAFIVTKNELAIIATPNPGFHGLDEDDAKEIKLDLTNLNGCYQYIKIDMRTGNIVRSIPSYP